MLLGFPDAGWIAVGGMVTAFIGGAFTLAGVYVNAMSQRKPIEVEPDDDPCAACRAELIAMEADRDRWRDMAEALLRRPS